MGDLVFIPLVQLVKLIGNWAYSVDYFIQSLPSGYQLGFLGWDSISWLKGSGICSSVVGMGLGPLGSLEVPLCQIPRPGQMFL